MSFSSSGSGFMGAPAASSYIDLEAPEQGLDYESRNGAASLGMRAQTWYLKHTGRDGRTGGHIFDWKRRESRRRGEELFRHDVDNFEFYVHNIVRAPGSRKYKVIRGRGKFKRGGSSGWGTGGQKKRGGNDGNSYCQGGDTPLHLRIPKLTKEQWDSVHGDNHYIKVPLNILNMCEDGESVSYDDLFLRGFPVFTSKKRWLVQMTGKEKDEFDVKNLTVYAHSFKAEVREKIEANGGQCIRLSEETNLPIDAESTHTLLEA